METPKFSLFEGGIKNAIPTGITTHEDVADRIKTSDDLAMRISIIRSLEGENMSREKSSLPYVTFSGLFKYRNSSNLEQYSGLICMDFDDVPNVEDVKHNIVDTLQGFNNVNPLLLFTSPSGNGLKIVLPTDNIVENHLYWFTIYASFFEEHFNMIADKSCKDITRACYLSYDPDAYAWGFEGYCDPLTNDEKKKLSEITGGKSQSGTANTEAVELTTAERSKNAKSLMFLLWSVRALHLQVCNDYDSYFTFVSACAKSTGLLGKDYCREICQRSLKYEEQAFEKLYSEQIDHPKNTFTFGTVKMMIDNLKNSQNTHTTHVDHLCEENWDINVLPQFIPIGPLKNSQICHIMGFITAMSAVMPHIFFWHDNQKYFLNLYTIIAGKLASGKSKATAMCHCIDFIDDWVHCNAEIDSDDHVKYTVREPANITDAALIWELDHNQDNLNAGSVLIETSELDVLAFGKAYGLSSENTRLAWGHEPIRCKRKGVDPQSRKEDRKGYEILQPKVSMLLCGTPSQLPHYFKNAADGNLSRFLIYELEENYVYRSGIYPPTVSYQNNNYDILFQMWRNQMALGEKSQFLCTDEQKTRLDEVFANLKEYFARQRDDFHNYINRLPVAVRRIAGVLSCVRYWTAGQVTPNELFADDDEWQTAIQLVLNSIPSIYKTYSNPLISKKDAVKRQTWVEMLKRVPTKFETATFLNVALETGYSEKSAKNALTYLQQNGYIKKLRPTHYEQVFLD